MNAEKDERLWCACKRNGVPHAWEPGEWCSPVRVEPKDEKVGLTEANLRAWFITRDGDKTWPFVEDDNANIHGYGHQDKGAFADAVNDWDLHCEGIDSAADGFDATVVTHKWAVMDPNGEQFWVVVPATDERVAHLLAPGPVTEHTPGAFPITCIWGQR